MSLFVASLLACATPETRRPPARIPACLAHAYATSPLVRGRASNPRGATIDLARGLKAIDDQRYNDAIPYLARALRRDPERGLAHLSLAEALLFAGAEPNVQAHHLAWSVQLLPDNPRAHLRYAQLLHRAGATRAARRQVSCALERRSNYAEALRLAAELDLRGNRLDEAERAARAAIRAERDDHRNWVILGEILKARGAHAAAGYAMLTAARAVGRSAPLYRRAARLFRAAREHDAAAAAYARADAIDPPPEARALRPLPRARGRRRPRTR